MRVYKNMYTHTFRLLFSIFFMQGILKKPFIENILNTSIFVIPKSTDMLLLVYCVGS